MANLTKPQHWTHVVVGAGSAGAVIAARLSADPSNRVLLLEAGCNYPSRETPDVVSSPNNWPLLAAGTHTWPALTACLTKEQGERPYDQGRGVGGSSAVNNTFALRALAADLRTWAAAGLSSLSWSELTELYVLLERDVDFPDAAWHGAQGPLPITRAKEEDWGVVDKAFHEAAVDLGYAWQEDLNAPGASGLGLVPMTILDGRRVSTNDAYLDPARERTNLIIRGDTHASKIVVRGARAQGIISHTNGQEQLEEAENVILCAGALQTPMLLYRSGVGPAEVLRQRGTEVLADLPVGQNLAEHPMIAAFLPLAAPGYAGSDRTRQGCCLLRTDSEPGRDDLHVAAFKVTPMGPQVGLIYVALMQCTSRGTVVPDPAGNPSIRFDVLSTDGDVTAMMRGVERLREFLATPALQAVSSTPLDVTGNAFDPPSSRDDLIRWMRSTCLPYRHAAGTCRMGEDDGSVVDTNYRVRGFENLFVADASILPDATSSNTNLTVIGLAERAARMLW